MWKNDSERFCEAQSCIDGPTLSPDTPRMPGSEFAGMRRPDADRSGEPDREAALRLESIEPGHRIWIVLTNKFKPILKRYHNCDINPRLWILSKFIDVLLV